MSVRLVVLVLSLPLLMGSEIYRYVDANGVVTLTAEQKRSLSEMATPKTDPKKKNGRKPFENRAGPR